MKLSAKAQRAIETYSPSSCMRAYAMWKNDGEGARTIGSYLALTTRQADAAINAGEELANLSAEERAEVLKP